MKKSQKKYHLAVSFTKYPEIAQLPSSKESRPQKKDRDTSRAYDSLENMFNNNFEMRLRKLEIQQRRNYEVVGYKEIQDIHLRLERKKILLKSGTKEDKQTQLTRGSIIKNNHEYLTKDEVIRHFSPHYLTAPSSRRSKQRATEARSLNTSKVMTKDAKKVSTQLNKHKTSQTKEFSICKLRQKMEEYQSGWIKQIEHKRKLVRKAMKPSQNPMISVIESVDQYRANSEERQKAIIEEKILTPSIWEKILRTSQEVGRNFKEITNISANGLKSIGRDKYRKELEWLEDKDRNGYFFKKDRSLVEYSQVCCE